MRNYLVYILDLSEEEEKRFAAELEGNFGANNVHRVGDNAYAVRTYATDLAALAKDAGVDEASGRMGFVVRPTGISGSFYDRFWDFIEGGKRNAAHAVAA